MTGRTVSFCKIRGKTINYNAKQLGNYEFIKDMFLRTGEPTMPVHNKRKIKRKRNAGGTVPIVLNPKINYTEYPSSNVGD